MAQIRVSTSPVTLLKSSFSAEAFFPNQLICFVVEITDHTFSGLLRYPVPICMIFVPALEFPVFRDLRQTIQTVIPVCIVPAFFDGEAFCFGCKCGCTAFLRIGSVFLCCHNVFFLYSFFRQIKQMVFAP